MANTYQETVAATNSQVSRFAANVEKVRKSPQAIRRLMLDEAQDMLNGEVTLVDPTNPFTMLMGTSAMGLASFVIDSESSDRKVYPALAQTEDDLYLHMSDKDYINRFATGAEQEFQFVVSRPELEARMVTDPSTGNRYVTIPRYSQVTVSDYVFTLLYNVNIILYNQDHWGVLYDAEEAHPLQNLQANRISWTMSKASALAPQMIAFKAKMMQYKVASKRFDVNESTGFKKSVAFADSFTYARVFVKNASTNNEWKEINTTHSDFVYDSANATACLKVNTGSLQVVIPQVYLTTGKVTGSVRVDIYSTKGEMALNTSNFLVDAFTSDWSVVDTKDKTAAVAGWQAILGKVCYANAMITGGKSADTFETLRSRVINNTVGQRQIPITEAQISAALKDQGFDIVLYSDTLTDRQFIATRALPKSFDERLVTAGNACIGTLVSTLSSLQGIPGVRYHAERVTITPDTVFLSNNGIVRPLTDIESTTLANLDPDAKANAVNSGEYLFSPFHYVLDPTDNSFACRAYFMGNPSIERQTYVDQNDTTLLQVSTSQVTLQKTTSGYALLVVTAGSDSWTALDDSQVHAQLHFIPEGESARAYLNGTLMARTNDNNCIFQFNIDSQFDTTKDHSLIVNSFKMVNLEDRDIGVSLLQDMELIYASSAERPSGWLSHALDAKLGNFLLPNRIAAITQERLSLRFGVYLENLWSSSRSFTSAAEKQLYDSDVYALYDADVYQSVPGNGNQIFHFDDAGGIVYNPIIHRRGEVVMDNGVPVIKHHKGEEVKDANGESIPVSPAYVSRQMDLFFIEGSYHFATDFSTKTYLEQMVLTVVDWITDGLADISSAKLEKTSISFYPKTSMGSIKGVADGGQVVTIEAAQSFAVQLFVPKTVMDNVQLQESLETNIIKIIDAGLARSTVSVSAIMRDMRKAFGDDVDGISLTGLGGDSNFEAFTPLDQKQRCSIAKELASQPNGELIVKESVKVDFYLHSASTD